MKIEYEPIGIIHSPFDSPEGIPIQPSRGRGIKGRVEVFEPFAEGLADLDGFSHIVLLFHLHRSEGYSLKVLPFLDDTRRGLFSTRAPRRPNPIGLSIVRLIEIRGREILIQDLDILNGSPVLDIKPYVRQFDEREEFRSGWLDNAAHRDRDVRSDDRFA